MIPIEPLTYLREHIGCMFSIAEFERHKLKWTKTKLSENDLKNPNINCCQELPTEITLESDYKGDQVHLNKENQDYAEAKLKELGVGYYVSSHRGKSDYIRFRFKTDQIITPALRLTIIRYLAKPGLKFDEAFFSLKYVRPVPNRVHWKHSTFNETVIKVVNGQDLDIDSLGIRAPEKPLDKQFKMISSGSLPKIRFKEIVLQLTKRGIAQ